MLTRKISHGLVYYRGNTVFNSHRFPALLLTFMLATTHSPCAMLVRVVCTLSFSDTISFSLLCLRKTNLSMNFSYVVLVSVPHCPPLPLSPPSCSLIVRCMFASTWLVFSSEQKTTSSPEVPKN